MVVSERARCSSGSGSNQRTNGNDGVPLLFFGPLILPGEIRHQPNPNPNQHPEAKPNRARSLHFFRSRRAIVTAYLSIASNLFYQCSVAIFYVSCLLPAYLSNRSIQSSR